MKRIGCGKRLYRRLNGPNQHRTSVANPLPLRPIQRDRHDGRHAPAHTRACDVPDHCARQQHGGQRERQARDCRQKLPENTDGFKV